MKKPRHVYNVWVNIEIQDVKSGDGSDVGLPDKLFTSPSEAEARAFVRSLPGWEEQGDTSDYRLHAFHTKDVECNHPEECLHKHVWRESEGVS